MGQTWSGTDWAVYARLYKTDQYAAEPVWCEDTVELNKVCGMFKHEVYKYALNHSQYHEIKTIYLYQGVWRMVKCERLGDCLQVLVTFRNQETMNTWLLAQERLAPMRWGIQDHNFKKTFTSEEDEQACTVRYVRRR